MNKYYIDAVIVVEGKSDVSYLSSFIDAQFFITNGYDISEEKIDILSRISKVQKVIIFTDNDEAGKVIERKIATKINSVIAVKSGKLFKNCSKKSGVAETQKSEIIKVLKPYISKDNKKGQKRIYNLASVISLSKNPEFLRERIIKEYRLIDGNNRFLEEQLNMLKVDEQEFKTKYGNQ